MPPANNSPIDNLPSSVRITLSPQLAYLKKSTHQSEALTELWESASEELSTMVGRLSKSATVAPYLPVSVRSMPQLIIKAGLPNTVGTGTGESPNVGATRMINGVLQEFRMGPAGSNRWMSTKADDKDKRDGPGQGAGKDQTGGPPADEGEMQEMSSQEKTELDKEVQSVKFEDVTAGLTLKDGTVGKEVPGKEVGGLVAHKENLEGSVQWVVTHKLSGKQVVGGIADEENAKKTAYQLSTKLNWDQNTEELMKDPNFADVGKFALHLRQNPYAKPPPSMTAKPSKFEEGRTAREGGEAGAKVSKSISYNVLSATTEDPGDVQIDVSNPIGFLTSYVYQTVSSHLATLGGTSLSEEEVSTIIREVVDSAQDRVGVTVAENHPIPWARFAHTYVSSKLKSRGVLHAHTNP